MWNVLWNCSYVSCMHNMIITSDEMSLERGRRLKGKVEEQQTTKLHWASAWNPGVSVFGADKHVKKAFKELDGGWDILLWTRLPTVRVQTLGIEPRLFKLGVKLSHFELIIQYKGVCWGGSETSTSRPRDLIDLTQAGSLGSAEVPEPDHLRR